MLHCFQFRDDIVAYDNESGALMLVDEGAEAVLLAYAAAGGKRPDSEILEGLAERHGLAPSELEEIAAEVDQLVTEGLLFRPAREISLKQLYPTEPRIKSMCLDVCHDCNLRCKYCFASTGDYGTGRRKKMSIETGIRAIDFLIEASGPRRNLDVDFFGGEPLLNWELVKAVTAYCEEEGPKHGKDIRLTLTTNAILLDDEKIDFLNEHMKNVVLSIDGRPSVQDDMRPFPGGQGSYERSMAGIRRFVEKRGDKEYYVRGTYTHQNTDFSEDVLHLAEQGLEQLSMEPVVGSTEDFYTLTAEDMPKVHAEYERLAERYLESRRQGKPFHFFHFNIDVEGGPCLYKKMKGCGVGTEYCAVTPDGDIYPCHQFVGEEAFIMGNLYDEPILHPPTALKEDLKTLILPNKEDCQGCWAKYFCSGGCAANAFHQTQSLHGIYEQGCDLQRKRLEAALWIQAKLRVEGAETAPESLG